MNEGFVFENVLLMIGSFMAFFFSLVVAFRFSRNNLPANYFLVTFMFILFLSLLLKLGDKAEWYETFPHLLKLNYPLGLLRPPLFYLYFFYLVRPQENVNAKVALHFIPFVVVVLYFLPYYSLSGQGKLELLEQASSRWTLPRGYYILSLIYSGVYLALSINEYRRFRKVASSLHVGLRQMASWLVILIGCYISFLFLVIISWTLPNLEQLQYYPFAALSVGVIIGCGRIFSFPDLSIEERKKERSAIAHISTEDRKKLMATINELLTAEKLYKQDDLRLSVLAEKLSLSDAVVSGIINDVLAMSFITFVNRHRIEVAKKLLKDPSYDHITAEGIGYEVGFNSRASFYAAFRRETGQSPAQYKKSV